MVIDDRPAEDLIHEIELSVQDELLKHPGKWAALIRTEILAVRDTSTEANLDAIEAGVATPILYDVPDNRAGFSDF